ncbi:MAG: ATP-binding protein, partial [SAR202 cluster bacterium]|nr:ATP-binding protein [SAR202 cluster bacterium]
MARSLVSFANTSGGKLLIGVKDTGEISGIMSEEELFMIENAAAKYCIPQVPFSYKEWHLNGKKILEINIVKSTNAPHKTPDQNGRLKAYVRIQDQNKLANGIQMKIWEKLNPQRDIKFVYSENAKKLLNMLGKYDSLPLKQIVSKLSLSRFKIENMIAELIIMRVINMTVTESITSFS